jgi:hypothetical protein
LFVFFCISVNTRFIPLGGANNKIETGLPRLTPAIIRRKQRQVKGFDDFFVEMPDFSRTDSCNSAL